MNDTAALQDPALGDGDGPPDDDLDPIEVEPEENAYPWAGDNRAVMLRSFIFQTLADSNAAVLPSIEHMDACFNWIWLGDLPTGTGAKKKPAHLKTVEPS